jgi:hypothetical protein
MFWMCVMHLVSFCSLICEEMSKIWLTVTETVCDRKITIMSFHISCSCKLHIDVRWKVVKIFGTPILHSCACFQQKWSVSYLLEWKVNFPALLRITKLPIMNLNAKLTCISYSNPFHAFVGVGWDWVHLVRRSPFGPVVSAPDDGRWVWSSQWNEWQAKPKYSEKSCPSATLSTMNTTWPGLNSKLAHRYGKPATNRLNYGRSQFQDANVSRA